MSAYGEVKDAANTTTTVAGGVDALVKSRQAGVDFGRGIGGIRKALQPSSLAQGHNAASAAKGIPGSNAIGYAGAALSVLGLGGDLWDMHKHGVSVDNTLSAATNATSALGLVSPHAAAASLGLTIGRRGDKRLGLSDKSSDFGMGVQKALNGPSDHEV